MIKYDVTHHYQPTNHTCAQTSLAMTLSHFDDSSSLDYVISNLPKNKDENGDDMGSVVQQLATWALSLGYDVKLLTSDMEILDLSWAGLSTDELIKKLESILESRVILDLGNKWSRIYIQSYIEFLKQGGTLEITNIITEHMIDELLQDGPLHVSVSDNVLHNHGRTIENGLRKTESDDLGGKLSTHSVVIYGKDNGKYLVADPWVEPGMLEFDAELVVVSVAAAQIQCDNIVMQIRKKS